MKIIAYEFLHPNGHAIVDYSERTYVGDLTAEKGYRKLPLVYANDVLEAVELAASVCDAMARSTTSPHRRIAAQDLGRRIREMKRTTLGVQGTDQPKEPK